MIIKITQNDAVEETEIHIICKKLTDEIAELVSNIGISDGTVGGKIGSETHFIKISEILYFEAVDDRTFFYTERETYGSPTRLYKIEEKLAPTSFARISKSVVANLKKVKSITPEKHSRLVATLSNGEKLLVSRQYVPEIKKKLGVE